jgi:Dynein heavy chain AAA lid domain
VPTNFEKVMYGGRVIDDFDRRIVKIYMDEYMGDFLFDTFQPFHFYHDAIYDYQLPEAETRQEFIGEWKLITFVSQSDFLHVSVCVFVCMCMCEMTQKKKNDALYSIYIEWV